MTARPEALTAFGLALYRHPDGPQVVAAACGATVGALLDGAEGRT